MNNISSSVQAKKADIPPNCFRRPSGDHAKLFSVARMKKNLGLSTEEVWDQLMVEGNFGDIIDDGGDDDTNIYAIWQNNTETTIIKIFDGDDGYGVIPRKLSVFLEDPIDFYSEIFSDPYWHAIRTIELDITLHQHILAAAAGNRPVTCQNAVVFWYIWTFYIGRGTKRAPVFSIALDEKTSEADLA